MRTLTKQKASNREGVRTHAYFNKTEDSSQSLHAETIRHMEKKRPK